MAGVAVGSVPCCSYCPSISWLLLPDGLAPFSVPPRASTRRPSASSTSVDSRDSLQRLKTVSMYDSRKKTQKLNSDVSPHRAVSVVRLLRIEQGGAFASLLNDKGRNSREREMDYVEKTLGFRTRDLDDRDIRLVLRVAFYELIKLGMPPYAVVDESVRIAKVALRPGAGNFVNAIMRKLILLKEMDSLPVIKVEGDTRAQARALAIIHSHPVWMVRRWIKLLGHEDAVRLMKWNNTEPRFSLRVNRGKGYTRDHLISQLHILKVSYEVSTSLADFVRIQTGMQVVMRAGLFKEGLCAVQDESAGLVVSVVDPHPGEMIIDCCAAPGGKSLYIASWLRGKGMVLAIDVNEGRLRVLKETAKLHNVDTVLCSIHADIRSYAKTNNMLADKVLLDAPCSGLGVLSKRADLRWNRSLEDLEQLKHLQDELLDASSLLVKPGGILVYSTCSIDPEENQERVDAFCLRQPEFTVTSVEGYVPHNFVTERGFYFSNPLEHSLDGAFAARLLRNC